MNNVGFLIETCLFTLVSLSTIGLNMYQITVEKETDRRIVVFNRFQNFEPPKSVVNSPRSAERVKKIRETIRNSVNYNMYKHNVLHKFFHRVLVSWFVAYLLFVGCTFNTLRLSTSLVS